MKTQLLNTALLLAASFHCAQAQWVIGGQTQNANNVFTNGKVGIGFSSTSTAPAERLHVNGGTVRITGSTAPTYAPGSVSVGAALIGNNAGTNSWIQSYGSSNSNFTPLILNPKGGSVAIGSAAVNATLTVSGNGIFTGPLNVGSNVAMASGIGLQVTGTYSISKFTDKVRINPATYGPASGTDALVTITGGDLRVIADQNYRYPGWEASIFMRDKTNGFLNIFQQQGSASLQMANVLRIGNTASAATYVSFWEGGKLSLGTKPDGTPLAQPQGYRLYVGEGIMTEKVKIASTNNTVSWPDYVFEENYKKSSLEEVERFVKANKHLPDVPSASEVFANGLDVAQMDAQLLKKVEELTLYLIEMEESNNRMEAKIAELKSKMASSK